MRRIFAKITILTALCGTLLLGGYSPAQAQTKIGIQGIYDVKANRLTPYVFTNITTLEYVPILKTIDMWAVAGADADTNRFSGGVAFVKAFSPEGASWRVYLGLAVLGKAEGPWKTGIVLGAELFRF